ncbi:PEP-CTERM sorting domain-containing protein [Aeoliella straminimaris]|nr:PEP-CTERM sorting domain-containing protein [Aeoliella straminimaris]
MICAQAARMLSRCSIVTIAATLALATSAFATIPYGSAGGPFPGFGPDVIAPNDVGGKEYSHDLDTDDTGALDPQQVIAWDGVGGVVDVADYTGTRPNWTAENDVDALANSGDYAYTQLKEDRAHLIFSFDDTYHTITAAGGVVVSTLPSAGPIALPIGMAGGAGELSYEEATGYGAAASTIGTWAKQAEINGMPLPDDVDAVEVWGPEPPLWDADKYSLDNDIFSGTSIWNASGSTYLPQSVIASAVISLLGPDIDPDLIDLDALMVHDVFGERERWDDGPDGPGDEIIFSIRQIPSAAYPSGFYATGSELFVLNASAPTEFLKHGGHVWDKTYALTSFNIGGDNERAILDINAIEAVGEFAVPEPASMILLAIGAGAMVLVRRKYQATRDAI